MPDELHDLDVGEETPPVHLHLFGFFRSQIPDPVGEILLFRSGAARTVPPKPGVGNQLVIREVVHPPEASQEVPAILLGQPG